MAQRSGADSLIAPRPKTASAGGILALAVAAALVVSGCGGGSSAAQTASGSQPDTSGGQGKTDTTTSPSSPSSADPASSKGAAAKDSNNPDSDPQSPTSSQSSGQGKHGQHIVLPKGQPEKAATPAEQAQATAADIALASPELQSAPGAEAVLSAANTCDGKNSSPQLAWQGIPSGTAELALFVMNVQPVGGKLFFDWAVSGIDPSLSGLEAGRLPKGTVVGRSSFGQIGYSICPPKGTSETYLFALYALPKRLSASKGFEPHQLRDQILEVSGDAGLMAAAYSRG